MAERRRTRKTEADEPVIQLLEETATVSTRPVLTGRVRISTTAEQFEEVAQAVLASETVEVTHVPIGREVDTPPSVRTEGELTIIPVLEEVLVIEKRIVLKEEIHVRRTTTTEVVEEPVKLRRQRAIVERS